MTTPACVADRHNFRLTWRLNPCDAVSVLVRLVMASANIPVPDGPTDPDEILVVDDSALDLRVVTRAIENDPSFRVRVARGASEALELLPQGRFAAVVTDHVMAGGTGLDFARTVRSRYPAVPVILMTAGGSEDLAFDAFRSGVGYIPKRRVMRELIGTIRQMLTLVRQSHDPE